MGKMLIAEHVCYSYHTLTGETMALSDVSFDVRNGEFAAVVGPSGCGKSTLLSLLCGLLVPDSGSVLLDGRPAAERRGEIGYMPQRDHLLPWRTLLRNVELGPEIQKKLSPETRQELLSMLRTYGLGGFEHARPSALSGGMRQRAALIRTLALQPDLLLLDEPFSALDYQSRLAVCDDISGIIRSTGKTAVLITHDLAEAVSMADRILVLTARPGRVRAVMETPFAPEYDTPLKRRSAPEFSVYFQKLWKELQQPARSQPENEPAGGANIRGESAP